MPNNLKNAKVGVNNSAVYAFAVDCAPVSATVSPWAENEVNWAKVNGLLDESLLGNNYKNTITRLQFCSIAVKLAEALLEREIEAAPSGTFKDTDNIYVRKAYAAGITTGTGEGMFSPNATLNRQQMATFVHRALMYVRDNSGIRYTIYDSQLGSYTDSSKIAAWAKEPMAFMNALGLVKGTTDTTLAPTANCTIEQAILVAQRSLSADQIGWYQCIQSTDRTTMGAQGDEFDKRYRFGYAGHTQVTFQCGDRLWISGARLGGEKGYGLLPTTNPYTGETCWVVAEGLKPVKDMD